MGPDWDVRRGAPRPLLWGYLKFHPVFLCLTLVVGCFAAEAPPAAGETPLNGYLNLYRNRLKTLSYVTKVQYVAPDSKEGLEVTASRRYQSCRDGHKVSYKPAVNIPLDSLKTAELLYQGRAEYQYMWGRDRVEFFNGVTGQLVISPLDRVEVSIPEAVVLHKANVPDHFAPFAFLSIIPAKRSVKDGFVGSDDMYIQKLVDTRFRELCPTASEKDAKYEIQVPGSDGWKKENAGVYSAKLVVEQIPIPDMPAIRAPARVTMMGTNGEVLHRYEYDYQVIGSDEPPVFKLPIIRSVRAYAGGNAKPYISTTIEQVRVDSKIDQADLAIDPSLAKDVLDVRSRVRILNK